MGKVTNIENMVLFKKACALLKKNEIPFDADKLKNNSDLCQGIIKLLSRYD